jgi:hypothetical protein
MEKEADFPGLQSALSHVRHSPYRDVERAISLYYEAKYNYDFASNIFGNFDSISEEYILADDINIMYKYIIKLAISAVVVDINKLLSDNKDQISIRRIHAVLKSNLRRTPERKKFLDESDIIFNGLKESADLCRIRYVRDKVIAHHEKANHEILTISLKHIRGVLDGIQSYLSLLVREFENSDMRHDVKSTQAAPHDIFRRTIIYAAHHAKLRDELLSDTRKSIAALVLAKDIHSFASCVRDDSDPGMEQHGKFF